MNRSEATNSYEVNTHHNQIPELCLVFPEKEINVGNQYTMTIELMNVIGKNGVNYGHPGVMYNVIDENNFDYVFVRYLLYSMSYRITTRRR